ncbi:hypothetical protein ACTXT7_017119, partial [Hymenolepis weldensis]
MMVETLSDFRKALSNAYLELRNSILDSPHPSHRLSLGEKIQFYYPFSITKFNRRRQISWPFRTLDCIVDLRLRRRGGWPL